MTNTLIAKLYLAINENATASQIDAAILDDSAEAAIVALSPEAFLEASYQAAFGRSVDAEGSAYYLPKLEDGTISQDDFAAILVAGADAYPADGIAADLAATDAEIAANKIAAEVTAESSGISAGNTASILSTVETSTGGGVADETTDDTTDDTVVVTDEKKIVILTDGRDNITTTSETNNTGSNDDIIYGDAGQNQNGAIANAFSTGDMIDGGAGNDTLITTIIGDTVVSGASQDLTINARVSNVETAKFELVNNAVTVDAGKMDSVSEFWSDNSDATLTLTDVRLGSKLGITKDITFGMKDVDSAAGLTVAFDSASLTKDGDSKSDSQVSIKLIDATALTVAAPVGNVSVTLGFDVAGDTYTLANVVSTDGTYEGLKDAIATDLAVKGLTDLSVSLGSSFTSLTTGNNTTNAKEGVTAQEIIITDGSGDEFTNVTFTQAAVVAVPTGFTVAGVAASVDATTSSALIETNLILDNAGRDSSAGAVAIGGMSNSAVDVQQINLQVDHSSAISSLLNGGTNYAVTAGVANSGLQKIVITSLTNKGDLEIGVLNSNILTIDASAFTGTNLMLGSTNEHNTSLTGVVTGNGSSAIANLGTLSANIASNVTVLLTNNDDSDSARAYTTGSGDDTIQTATTYTNTNGYMNSKTNDNLSIDSGAGNDTIRTVGTGDYTITASTGNDTVYANNDQAGNAVGATARTAEVQTLTMSAATAVGGTVTTTLADGSVYQTVNAAGATAAAVAANVAASINAGATEVSTITFTALNVGDSITVDGVTVTATATAGLTANAVAAIFAAPTVAVAGATVAGTASSLFTVVNAGAPSAVGTFTSATANTPVADIAVSTTGAADYSISTVQGATAFGAGAASTAAGTVAITYPANFVTTGEDIAMATVSDVTTGVTVAAIPVATTAIAGADVVNAITEIQTVTNAGTTLAANVVTIDGTTVTFTDTDATGSISAYEQTQQLLAATYANYTATAGTVANTVVFTANTAGVPTAAFAVAGTALATVVAAATQVGVAATPASVATTAQTQTLTIATPAVTDGTITLNLDVDSDGVIGTDEQFEINVTAGDVGTVAAQVATAINAIPGMTAAQGTVAAATAANVVMTWATTVVAADVPALTTVVDGSLVTATTFVETTKGLDADTTEAATWLVNAANLDIDNLNDQTTPATAKAILANASVTVTLSGATFAQSGEVQGAAAALTNGFESTVTIGNTNYLGNQMEINAAIVDAINSDATLSKLLVATQGLNDVVVVTSLIDGKVLASDLQITLNAPTTLTTSELSALNLANQDLLNDSTVVLTSTQMLALIATNLTALDTASKYTTEVLAQNDDVLLGTFVDLAGANSTTQSDNKIDLGAGNDVVVLGTEVNSNDTVVFTGTDIGSNVVVNFVSTSVVGSGATNNLQVTTAADQLDFTSYLTDKAYTTGSTSTTSQSVINNTIAADADLAANEVFVNNTFAQDIAGTNTETWANLTAANVLAAIKTANTGTSDYGNITAASLTVETPAAGMVSTTQSNVYMVENDLNAGEYKIFDITSTTSTTDEFTGVTLLGTVDFGSEVALATADLV